MSIALEPSTLAGESTTMGGADASRSASLSIDAIPRGSAIGRYVVVGGLGEGAMGVVVLAYDPDLDRRVALKLLRGRDEDGSIGRARLLREAQAMARLNHPSVVTVHDVGEHAARVYVAMELVEGKTLRAWQKAAPRSWREIVAVYRQAGAGLAAAHAAGLVHRDFKPDNVLVANDGRVLVTDFGLARTSMTLDTAAESGESTGSSRVDLTATGTLAGTPAYMAPEQLAGRGADERSDQFAFCVALFEGLFGARPFAASTLAELVRSVGEGRILEPERSRVPGWVRAAVRRGLAVDPSDRHASMQELLRILGRDRSRSHTRVLAIVGGATIVGATAIVAARPIGNHCRAGAERVGAVWNDARADAIGEEFAATSIPHAAATWASTRLRIDAWGTAWAEAHRQACEATHVRGEQSGERLDARMACLQERIDHLDALLDELATADADVVGRVHVATTQLPDPAGCEDPQVRAVALDPATVSRIDEARVSLAIARARQDTGRYAAALEAAAQAEALVGSDDAALAAEILATKGQLHKRAGDATLAEQTLQRSLRLAVQSGNAVTEAEAWIVLMQMTGFELGRAKEATALVFAADLAVERSGRPDLRLRLHDAAGVVLTAAGDRERALEHHRLAIAAVDATNAAPLVRAVIQSNYGNTLFEAARYDEARAAFESALAADRELLGDEHPSTATSLFHVARVTGAHGDYEQSAALYREVIRIREATLGPAHREVGDARLNYGLILSRQGDRAGAQVQLQRALEIWEAALEPGHPYIGIALNNLGTNAMEQERHDEALAYYRRAEAHARQRDENDPRRVAPLLNQGNLHVERGAWEAAIAVFDVAIALNERRFPTDHPDAAYPLVGKARALIGAARADEAIPLAERALALRDGHAEPAEMYLTYFTLARAVWDAGDRPRAIDLARRAREAFDRTGLPREDSGPLIEWAKERGIADP